MVKVNNIHIISSNLFTQMADTLRWINWVLETIGTRAVTQHALFGSDLGPGLAWIWPKLPPGALGSDRVGLEAKIFLGKGAIRDWGWYYG